jgi:hypothetical protein
MGGYHSVSEYSTTAKAVYFGGGNGSRDLYKLESTGQITKMANAPVVMGVYNGGNAPLTADPVSGELLVLGLDRNLYAYNPASNAWRTMPQQHPFSSLGFTVTVPVNTYGVVMVLQPGKITLYKHNAGGVGVQNTALAPAGETGLTATPNPFHAAVAITVNGNAVETLHFQGKRHGNIKCNVSTMSVYDTRGRMVDRIVSRDGTFSWNASGMPAGVYLARVNLDGKTYQKKLLRVK